MKKRIITLSIMLTILFSVSWKEAIAQKSDNNKPELTRLISKLTTNHKKYRTKTSDIYKRNGFDSRQMEENEQNIAISNEENIAQARKILKKFGFPTISMVGKEKAHEFWMIVQSSDMDTEFQLMVLKKMDALLEKKEVSQRDYAYLSDRIKVNLGLKQDYGTQVHYDEKTKSYEPYELNNTEKVDKLRKEMNLEPLTSYLKSMDEKYEGSIKRNKNSRRLIKKKV